jgi:hypothetical protein
VTPNLASRWRRAALLPALSLVAALAPLALVEWASGWIGMSYSVRSQPFELLGLTGGALLLFAGARAWRRTAGAPLAARVEAAVPLLVALHFLVLTSEYSERRFDYDCYEYAGRALLAGESPYRTGLIYLYPPLTAQAMAAAFTGVEAASGALGWGASRDAVWERVFYLYQCAQLALVVLAYPLLRRFARRLGLDGPWMPVLVGLLLVFDDALFRTLRHGQINLWVLNLSLVALLAAERRPLLSGLALALAGHMKLYPLLLLLPLALARHLRALAASVACLAGIALVLADFGRDWTLWREFAALAAGGFPGEIALRNSSAHAIFYNATRLLTGAPRAVGLLSNAAVAAAALWWLARAALRERAFRAQPAGAVPQAQRLLLNGADALAFALLLSPSVWEHHYVMALPLALAAIALRGRERPGLVALGIFLMLAMPTFDLFPLSAHRLAGMLLLLGFAPARRFPG